MIVSQVSHQSSGCIDSNPRPSVVSEFRIRDIRYLVIATETPQEDHELLVDQKVDETLKACLENLNISGCAKVDYFAIKNQMVVIVEVQPCKEEGSMDLASLLTARELQIATLVAQGLPNKKVAKKLHISEWTVATHLRRIFAKLHVDSRAAMVYCCAPLIQRIEHV